MSSSSIRGPKTKPEESQHLRGCDGDQERAAREGGGARGKPGECGVREAGEESVQSEWADLVF